MLRILCCLICFTTAVKAEVNAEAFSKQLSMAQSEIYQDIESTMNLEGCFLRRVDTFKAGTAQSSTTDTIRWLADFETVPSEVVKTEYQIFGAPYIVAYFPLRNEVSEVHRTQINRYYAANDRSLFGHFSEAEYARVLSSLYEDRLSGAYGPLLQRNIGKTIESNDLPVPAGLMEGSLSFAFNGDDVDGFLATIHQYRLENYPPNN